MGTHRNLSAPRLGRKKQWTPTDTYMAILLLIILFASFHPTPPLGVRFRCDTPTIDSTYRKNESNTIIAQQQKIFLDAFDLGNAIDLDSRRCMQIILERQERFQAQGRTPQLHARTCLSPRTLFYIDWDYINNVMDRHFLHTFCGALASQNSADDECISMWGPGWLGWEASQTPKQNIASRWTIPFDMIVLYRHERSEVDQSNAIIAAIREECVFHEIDDNTNVEKWSCRAYGKHPEPWKNYDIVFLKYRKDFNALREKLSTEQEDIKSLIMQWHQAILPGNFMKNMPSAGAEDSFDARPFDFCLVGCTYSHMYPIRAIIEKWISEGIFASHEVVATQLPHFGYSDIWSREAQIQHGINYTTLEAQYDNYVQFLFQCKSILVTRSARDYELKKYIEASLAGALLIGDIPSRYADDPLFSSIVLDIHEAVKEDRPNDVMATLKEWLSKSKSQERQDRLHRARNLMLRYRTSLRAWKTMQEAFHMYLAGNRGFSDCYLSH